MNDDSESFDSLAALISSLDGRRPDRLDLLPYHEIGADKYLRLGRAHDLQAANRPTEKSIRNVADFFRRLGLEVKIGG